MKLKALIFDVDGTLADTEETHRLAFNEAFASVGLDWQWDRSLYARLLRTTGGKERIATFIDTLGTPQPARERHVAMIPEIHRRKTALYASMVEAGKAPLRDGVERLLDEARHAGVRLAIATTTTFENIRALIDTNLGSGAIYRFDVIGAGDDVPCKKPAPDVYHFVMRKLGLGEDVCVAIEDSANGLKAARAAGLFTVVTPSFWTMKEDLADANLLLPTLGTAARPLSGPAAEVVGNSLLGIADIDRILTAARMDA
jgi:beta-phosphoglucomutase-like phosphatase (HAD superfamily)